MTEVVFFAPATIVEADGFPWPVLVIGGGVVLLGLVALRGEIRNWRQRVEARRVEHSD